MAGCGCWGQGLKVERSCQGGVGCAGRLPSSAVLPCQAQVAAACRLPLCSLPAPCLPVHFGQQLEGLLQQVVCVWSSLKRCFVLTQPRLACRCSFVCAAGGPAAAS